MVSLEKLSEKAEKCGPVRDGKNAIPVSGPTVNRTCQCGCGSELEVPDYIFNGDGKVKGEYREGVWLSSGVFVGGRELSNGGYICDNGRGDDGVFFYRLGHWSSYCDE